MRRSVSLVLNLKKSKIAYKKVNFIVHARKIPILKPTNLSDRTQGTRRAMKWFN